MNCPYCGYYDSRVLDSRDVNDGIRRRRQCLECDSCFTTYERVQPASLFVIKKDNRREEFNKDKLLTGIRKACEKRPVPVTKLEEIVEEIETMLQERPEKELKTSEIGRYVMDKLKELDKVAYVRFASVYREFKDVNDFFAELKTLLSNQRK